MPEDKSIFCKVCKEKESFKKRFKALSNHVNGFKKGDRLKEDNEKNKQDNN